MKYGEEASPYFNVLLFASNGQQEALIYQAEVSPGEENSHEKREIEFGEPVTIAIAEDAIDELSLYFNQLFRQLVTITNPGDSSSLLLTVYFPLFTQESISRLTRIVEAVKGCSYAFEIDLIAIGNDLQSAILIPQDGRIPTAAERLNLQSEVFNSVVSLKRENRSLVSHVIPICNVNSRGFALNLNGETMVRMLGELAILFVTNYNRFMRQIVDDDNRDITAMGMSQIYLDEYYFTQYLLHKAFLHVLDREKVSQESVDLNKIAPIAQRCLLEGQGKFDARSIFSDFWKESKVENLLAQNMTEAQIIAELSPQIERLFHETLPARIQSFIPDESLSLPERKCILALLLGQDDEQFYNDLYDDHQLFIDDIVNEPLRLFVEENNLHKKVEQDENGKERVTHAVLDNPLDASDDVFVPLDLIRDLKKRILSSSKYIRIHEQELEELESQAEDSLKTEKRLLPSGFKFNDTIYKLQNDVSEHALQEDYVAHDPVGKSIDLRKFFSEVRDQGEEGACASFAAVSVFEYFQHRYGFSENYDMSPAFAYYNARTRNGNEALGTGSSISDNIESMHEHGLCHEDKWKYSAENIDLKPSEEAYNDAKAQSVTEALNVRIDGNPEETLRTMKSALCDGYPIMISLRVYDSFSAPKGFVPHPTEEELKSSSGNTRHALVLCGYSDEHRFFIARNSWGKQFGDKGYCYIPYSYISDPVQCECAFVITKVTPNKSSFKKAESLDKVPFNITDIAIRRAVIKNLVAEERIYLSRLKTQYDSTRMAFEHLFKKLCNNHNRTKIRNLAEGRLHSDHVSSRNEINQLQQKRVEEISNHKKTTRSRCLSCGLTALGLLLGAYLTFSTDFDYKKHIGYGIISLAVLLILFIALYWPYRKVKAKQLDHNYMEQINYHTNRKTNIEKHQSALPIKLHLAGVFLEQYDGMRNRLMNKYNCMLSFVGNLKVWHEEERDRIEVMKADSRPPFVAVLDNDSLDEYFDHHAQQATSDIHLTDFFNQGYSLDEPGIIDFWFSLNKGMADELLRRLDGFSMYNYILGIGYYPYLPNQVEPSELLPILEDRSKVFVQWHQFNEQTPEAKYIMLHFDDDKEESRWWSSTSDYFQNRPLSIPITSKFKLIMLEIKNLKMEEIELT